MMVLDDVTGQRGDADESDRCVVGQCYRVVAAYDRAVIDIMLVRRIDAYRVSGGPAKNTDVAMAGECRV